VSEVCNKCIDGRHDICTGWLEGQTPFDARDDGACCCTPDGIRTFHLERSGISGTGKVAEGTQYSDGVCTLHWTTQYASTVVYPDLEHVIKIHSHDGATRIVFDDQRTDARLGRHVR
jgi:hypothetical protein